MHLANPFRMRVPVDRRACSAAGIFRAGAFAPANRLPRDGRNDDKPDMQTPHRGRLPPSNQKERRASQAEHDMAGALRQQNPNPHPPLPSAAVLTVQKATFWRKSNEWGVIVLVILGIENIGVTVIMPRVSPRRGSIRLNIGRLRPSNNGGNSALARSVSSALDYLFMRRQGSYDPLRGLATLALDCANQWS